MRRVFVFTPEGWKQYEAEEEGWRRKPGTYVIGLHTGNLLLFTKEGLHIRASTFYIIESDENLR